MSDLLNIPKPTLSVILSNLIRAGILQSKEGVNGGLRMAKSEKEITLLDLLLAIENEKPLFQTEFDIKAKGQRPDNAKKTIHSLLQNTELKMKADLKKTTLKDILDSM